MTPALHPRLVDELARLGRFGVSAAQARRLVGPLCEQLGVPRPGYTAVLLVVQESPPLAMPPRGSPSPLDSIVVGRMPTPTELEATKARARVHLNRLQARRHGLVPGER